MLHSFNPIKSNAFTTWNQIWKQNTNLIWKNQSFLTNSDDQNFYDRTNISTNTNKNNNNKNSKIYDVKSTTIIIKFNREQNNSQNNQNTENNQIKVHNWTFK